jgi:predicted nucleic acid-binding protein
VRILVDTSVWSLAFARRSTTSSPKVERLARAVREGEVVLLGVVLQEVLQAFRHARDVRRVARALAPFPRLQLSRSDYEAASALHRTCAASGIAASTIDCQIAAAAIENRCKLLTADADFERMAEVSTLALLR